MIWTMNYWKPTRAPHWKSVASISATFGEEETEQTVPFTPAIKVGCLMYIAYLYTNREAVTDLANLKPAPMTISALWDVYREPCVY